MGNVVDRIVAGHVLLLQEERGVGFSLGKNCHKHVGARHLLAARRLNVNHGALDHALESGGGFGLSRRFRHQVGKFGVDIVGEVVAQFFDVDAAGLHHGHCVLVLRQGEQEMFERRKLLTALSGVGERTMQGLLKGTRKCRQGCVLSPGRVSLFPLTVNVQAGLKVAM